jgi:hypothetical protein
MAINPFGPKLSSNLIDKTNDLVEIYDASSGETKVITLSSIGTTSLGTRQTTTYTLSQLDSEKVIEINSATAVNVTVPANVFNRENQVNVAQYGAGQVTFVAGAGMTLRSPGGKLKLTSQYSTAGILFISSTEAYVIGDLTT